MKSFFSGLLLLNTLLFSGCILPEPCYTQEMTVHNVSFSNEELLSEKVCLDNVSGGKETNPRMSNVGNAEFAGALKNSLIASGIYSAENGNYLLSASILEEDAPLVGMTLRVTEHIRYELREIRYGDIVYEKTIRSSGSATFGEEFAFAHRLRIAKERAIKANIERFLKDLDRNFTSKNQSNE